MSELVLGVSAVREATPGSRIVRLDLNGAPFTYEPGQAAAIGPAELSARVPFSIASAPEETRQLGYVEFLIKVDAAGRWGTGFPSLIRGARVALDGPTGSFTFPRKSPCSGRPVLSLSLAIPRSSVSRSSPEVPEFLP